MSDSGSKPNAQYNEAAPGGIVDRVSLYQRKRIYRHYRSHVAIEPNDTILDVGATSDEGYDHSNYVLNWTENSGRITALGVDEAAFLEQRYPGLTYHMGDGCNMPFEDNSFDHVHSSAVLEHVGNHARQVDMIAECLRVARKSVYLTTPNPSFPIEFHTALPLVHWLPKSWFRRILRLLGKSFFAEESNLNLMRPWELRTAAREAQQRISALKACPALTVTSVPLAMWPANSVCYVIFDGDDR